MASPKIFAGRSRRALLSPMLLRSATRLRAPLPVALAVEIDRAGERPVILPGRGAVAQNAAVADGQARPPCSRALSRPGRETARARRRRPAAWRRRRTGSTGCRRCSPRSAPCSVSPERMVMRSIATSSSSAAICAIAVSTPWPSSTRPVSTVTLPGRGEARPSGRGSDWPRAGRAGARSSACSRAHCGCRLFDRAHDAVMRAAAADIAVERLRDLAARRLRVFVEQRLGRDQDARQAIAALAGLLVDESLLQRVRALGAAQALDGGDRFCRRRSTPAWRSISPARRRSAPCSSRIARARSRSACPSGRARCAARRAAASLRCRATR